MNKAILIGRLARDPEYKIIAAKSGDLPHARFTLAVDRIGEGADFISCEAFGKNADFAQKYLKKGTKIAVEGRIQTGSYTKQDGTKVYTTDVVVERHEFVESRREQTEEREPEGFVDVPEGIDDELPFR